MAEISTNIILDGITLALRDAFPEIYIESNTTNQELQQPAFLVLLETAQLMSYPSGRQKRLARFDITYFPTCGQEECYSVADTLGDIFRLLVLPSGDKLHGTDMSFSVTDGVLHFLVSYNHFAFEESEEEHMEKLKIT